MKKTFAASLPALALALFACAPARAEVVIIVSSHASQSPQVTQVCQAFLGKIKAPTPVSFGEKNPLRDEFYSKACKKDPAQVQSILGKLLFTGTGTPPAEVDSAAAMKKAVAADANAVGYLDKKDLDGSVKAVASVN